MIFPIQKPVNRLITVLSLFSLLMLAGCSNLQTGDEQKLPEITTPTEKTEPATVHLPEERPAETTQSTLTGDMLYKLLVAEIAGQRGELDLSISNYMELAKQHKDPVLAERATRIMIYARKDKKALEATNLWVKYAPENMEARQILAAMYIRNNNADEALQQLEHFLGKHPEETGKAMHMLSNFLNRPEDKGTAFRVMDRLMTSRQDNVEAMFAYGLLTLRAGDTEKAREIVEKVTKLAPEKQDYQLVYLSILEKDGDKQTAFQYLERLLKQQPDNFDFRIAHARMQADFGRYDEARKEFKALTISHPDSTDSYYALGLLNLQTNHSKEAKKQFKYLISKQVLVNESSYYLGQIAEFEKDFEEAIIWHEAIDNSSAHYFDAQIKIAVAKARLGKLDESRATLAKIQAHNHAQELQLVRVEAEILIEEGKLPEAKAVYDKAIGDGHDPDLLYSRAMLAEKMGRMDLLEQDLKTVIKHDPTNADVLNALGYTLADRTDRYQEAHDYIKKALDLSPDNFYILDSMGWVLYRMGCLEESIQYLKRAKEMNNDPEVSAHLSEVLWVKGDKKEAREIMNSALKTTPEDKKLLEVLKRLKL